MTTQTPLPTAPVRRNGSSTNPYAAPRTVDAPRRPPAAVGARGKVRPVAGVGAVASVLFGVVGVILLGAIVNSLGMKSFLAAVASGDGFDPAVAHRLDRMAGLLGIAYLATVLVAGLVLLIWFRRSYANTTALFGHRTAYRHFWASWCWFIPIANLLWPFRIAEETHDASGATARRCLAGWWGCFILGVLTARAGGRLQAKAAMAEDSTAFLERMDLAVTVGIAADALLFLAAVLLIVVIRNISEHQTRAMGHRVGRPAPCTDPVA